MDSALSTTVLIYGVQRISQFGHISFVRFGYLEGGQTNRKSDNLCNSRYTLLREPDFIFDNKRNCVTGIKLITVNQIKRRQQRTIRSKITGPAKTIASSLSRTNLFK